MRSCLYLKSGCPWRFLPKDFPAWKTVYHHFRAWSRSGVLVEINARLRKMVRRLEGRNIHPSAGIIDSQSVRSNGHGGLVGYDAGKKIKGRKRFVCVDTLGGAITPANVPERSGAKELLQPILRAQRLGKKISAYAGFHTLPKCWVVERTYAWIVQHRRLVHDYERFPECAAAWVFLAMIRIMINLYS